MLEQQRAHLLDGSVVVGVQAELGEALVLAHQLRRRDAEQPQTFSEKEEVARLRRENEQLRMERDFLKKAAAFFAKESK